MATNSIMIRNVECREQLKISNEIVGPRIRFLTEDKSIWPEIRNLLQNLSSPQNGLDEIFSQLCSLHSVSKRKWNKKSTMFKMPYEGLVEFVVSYSKKYERDFTEKFCLVIMPTIAKLALRLEQEAKQNPLYCMRQNVASRQALDRTFVASILSHSVLCLLPSEGKSHANFNGLYNRLHARESQSGKLRCVMEFFYWLGNDKSDIGFEAKLRGQMIFQRLVLQESTWNYDLIFQRYSEHKLCDIRVNTQDQIEDASFEYLHVDFANRWLGGGVLCTGCVQEEIAFVIYPELLVGMLFMESMTNLEAIQIYGFQRFSEYEGYASTFTFKGPYLVDCPRDRCGNILRALIAIDAIPYGSRANGQYNKEEVFREFTKAFVGFTPFSITDEIVSKVCNEESGSSQNVPQIIETDLDESASKQNEAQMKYSANQTEVIRNVATGNWGCGAFRGDPQLKSLVQWLAASCRESPHFLYFSFHDPRVYDLQSIANRLVEKSVTVAKLFQLIIKYCQKGRGRKAEQLTLFSFIEKSL